MSKASHPLTDLGDTAIARAVLDALKLKLDGIAEATETVRRKRRTLVNALHYAVDLLVVGCTCRVASGPTGGLLPRGFRPVRALRGG